MTNYDILSNIVALNNIIKNHEDIVTSLDISGNLLIDKNIELKYEADINQIKITKLLYVNDDKIVINAIPLTDLIKSKKVLDISENEITHGLSYTLKEKLDNSTYMLNIYKLNNETIRRIQDADCKLYKTKSEQKLLEMPKEILSKTNPDENCYIKTGKTLTYNIDSKLTKKLSKISPKTVNINMVLDTIENLIKIKSE